MEERIPAHLEVAGLLRGVEAAGGFGTVIKKGERDAGTLLVICCEKGTNCRAYERLPRPDGTRGWAPSRAQNTETPWEFSEYLQRRARQDNDLWILELDIANGERFIGLAGTRG